MTQMNLTECLTGLSELPKISQQLIAFDCAERILLRCHKVHPHVWTPEWGELLLLLREGLIRKEEIPPKIRFRVSKYLNLEQTYYAKQMGTGMRKGYQNILRCYQVILATIQPTLDLELLCNRIIMFIGGEKTKNDHLRKRLIHNEILWLQTRVQSMSQLLDVTSRLHLWYEQPELLPNPPLAIEWGIK